MCGISGIINWLNDFNNNNSDQNEIIKKMNDSIIHRGPDEEGYYFSKHALFGHRRLVIIDKEGGIQPMIYKQDYKGNDDEQSQASVILSYNGELYNFQELKVELEKLGNKFKTRSDTEVVLLSYIEWGEHCVSKFNGIFAFAIYDERKSSLYLVRDRMGVKPLYYTILEDEGNTILFGSEIKVILTHPLVKPYVDKEGLNNLFTMGPIKSPDHCIYRDIKLVPAGSYITFTRDTAKITSPDISTRGTDNQKSEEYSNFRINKVEYWNLKSFKHSDNLEETTNQVFKLLKQSVGKQLVSDEPIGFLLSGGIDSSSVVAITSKVVKPPTEINTFSLTFENEESDFRQDYIRRNVDEPFSKLVSKDCSTNHSTVTINSENDLQGDNLYKPLRAFDYPSTGNIDSSFIQLFKQIKNQSSCKVILSGELSDEIFSGYTWFSDEQVISHDIIPSLVGVELYNNYNLYLKDEILENLDYKNFKERKYNELLNQVPYLDSESNDPLQRKQRILSYFFIKYFAHFLLERKDRCSMQHSIEVRVPFGDHDLIEYCWNIPYRLKTVDNIEKGILRRSMGDLLPKEVQYRKKSAYPQACDKNYFYSLCDQLEIVLNDTTSPIHQFIKREPIHEIIKNKLNILNPNDERNLFEHLLLTNQWIKEYKIIFV